MSTTEMDEDWKMKEFLKSTKSVRGGYRAGAGRPKKYVGMERKEVRKMYRMRKSNGIQLPTSYTQSWNREKSRLGLSSDVRFIQHLLHISQQSNEAESEMNEIQTSTLSPPFSHSGTIYQEGNPIINEDHTTGNIRRTNLQTRMMPLKHRQISPSIPLSRFVFDDFDAARIEMEKDNDGFIKYLLKLHYRHCVEGDEICYSDFECSENEAAEIEDNQHPDSSHANQEKECGSYEHVSSQDKNNGSAQEEVLDLSTVRVKKEKERSVDNPNLSILWSNQRSEDLSISATQKVDIDLSNRSANNKKLVFINAIDPASKAVSTSNSTSVANTPLTATETSLNLTNQVGVTGSNSLSQPVNNLMDQVGFPVMMAAGMRPYASVNQAIPLLAIPTTFSPNVSRPTAAWTVPLNNDDDNDNNNNAQSASSSNITMSGTADSPNGLPSSVTVRELIYGDHTGLRGRRKKTQWTHYTPNVSNNHPALPVPNADVPSNAVFDILNQQTISNLSPAQTAFTNTCPSADRSPFSQIDSERLRDIPLKQKSKIVQYQLMHPGKEHVTKSGVTFCEFRFTDRHLVQSKTRSYGGKKFSTAPKRYSPRKRQEPIPGTCKFKLDKETGDLVRKERTWMPPIAQDEPGNSYPQPASTCPNNANQQQSLQQKNENSSAETRPVPEEDFNIQGNEVKHSAGEILHATGENDISEQEEEDGEQRLQEISGSVSLNQTAYDHGNGLGMQWEVNQKFMANGNSMQIFTMAMSCSVCRKSFKSKKALESHERSHGRTDPAFRCQLCGFTAQLYYVMDIHMKSTHENTSEKCDHCGENVPGHNIEQHMELVHEDMSHICKECGKLFFSQQKLHLHTSQCHVAKDLPTSSPYDDYSAQLKTKQVASNPVQLGHYKIKPYRCDIKGCGKMFGSKTTLNSHLLVHSGDKHHICKFCQQRFRTNWQLKVHLRRHTDEKPIKCDQCDYRCRQRASLNWHMRKHRQECAI